MESKTYKIDRKSNSLDIVNLEYSNIDGYKIKPKVNKENTIKVDNIIFTNPSLIKKIIKKKINIKIKESRFCEILPIFLPFSFSFL